MNKSFSKAVIAFMAIPFLFSGSFAKAQPFDSVIPNAFKRANDVKEKIKSKLPEIDGTYDVDQQPDLQLNVIVNRQTPDQSPAVVQNATSCSDPSSLPGVSTLRWKLPQGNVNYVLNTSSAPSSVGASNFTALASQAFSQWSNATNNKVTFSRSSSAASGSSAAQDGKNIVAWGTTPSNALGVTYTWYNRRTGIVTEVDTILNKNVRWAWSSQSCTPNVYDAQNILTHELGHWMGLSDMYTSNYQNATMFGYGSRGEIKKDTLSAGDISSIKRIYQ